MSGSAVEAAKPASPSVGDRIMDAGHYAAHLSHKARLVKSLAEDAVEDGVNVVKRTVKSVRRGIERMEDVKDEGIHLLKRRPLKTIAMTAAVGFTVGLIVGWIAGRFTSDGTGKS